MGGTENEPAAYETTSAKPLFLVSKTVANHHHVTMFFWLRSTTTSNSCRYAISRCSARHTFFLISATPFFSESPFDAIQSFQRIPFDFITKSFSRSGFRPLRKRCGGLPRDHIAVLASPGPEAVVARPPSLRRGSHRVLSLAVSVLVVAVARQGEGVLEMVVARTRRYPPQCTRRSEALTPSTMVVRMVVIRFAAVNLVFVI